MSFLDRFRRKDEEGSDRLSIYKDEPATNRLASFLFGFFALFVTLLIAAGLFFGGRAVYRALNGSDGGKNPGVSDNKDTGSTATVSKPKAPETSSSKKTKKSSSTPSTGDNLPSTGDNLTLPKTGDPGM